MCVRASTFRCHCLCACVFACACKRMWYVLIPGKQTAVWPGRLVLSECVYLNSPQSLSVLPSITRLKWLRALLCLTRKHTLLKYDDMTVRVLLTACDYLCLCQDRMQCFLGWCSRWCFHCSPLWPWLCKQVCKVTMSAGAVLHWQRPINRLNTHVMPTWHITHIMSRCVPNHNRGASRTGVNVHKRDRASARRYEIHTLSCTHCMFTHTTSPPAWRMTSSFEGMTLSPCCLSLGSRPAL